MTKAIEPQPETRSRYASSVHLPGIEIQRATYTGPLFGGNLTTEYVLWQLLDGANDEWHERDTTLVKPGTVQMVNPGHFVRPVKRWTVATEDLTIRIDPATLYRAFVEAKPSTVATPWFRLFQTDDALLRQAACNLAACLLGQQTTPLECQTAFVDLVSAMIRHQGTPERPQPAPRRELLVIRDFLDTHFTDAVSLESLGTLTGLSRFHIVRHFRATFGVPPHAYQTHRRIAHARRLMRSGFPLTHLGVEVGFSDQSHFYRHFKRIVGVTPRVYQDCCSRMGSQ